MDWKILAVVLVVVVGFFAVQTCSEKEKPDYDKIQAKERAEQLKTQGAQQKNTHLEARIRLQEEARLARGSRPQPRTFPIETENFVAVFSNRGGALARVTMKDPQYLEAPRRWDTGLRDEKANPYTPVDLVTTNTQAFELSAPLRFDIYEGAGLEALLPDPDYEMIDRGPDHILFHYAQPGLPIEIYKKFEVLDKSSPYMLWLTVRVVNTGQKTVRFRSSVSQHGYQHKSEAGGSMFSTPPNLLQGICRYGTETFTVPWTDSDLDESFSGVGDVHFTGVHTNYFLSAMIPGDDNPVTCNVSKILDNPAAYPTYDTQPWGHVLAELRFGEVSIPPGESHLFKVKNYLGPKRYQELQRIGGRLEKSVDFGMFWPICQVLLWLLFWFQSIVVNWGLAIILITIVVKLVLLPLTHRSFQSSNKMKLLKPEIDKINERLKDDPQAKQQAIMAFYKQNGVNPVGGCLPMLLQMPIWIALYSTLRTSPELYRAPFYGWIKDLSSPDPYFVTPVVMGAMMFLQNRFTPAMGDALQAKMMTYFMPIMFTAMMLFLPSGLTIYILVNTVLSIAHQVYIQKRSTLKA